MTAATLARDLIAFSLQITLVTLAIALLMKVVRIPARVRYAGLRLALVSLLLVPWLLRTPENRPATTSGPAPLAAVADRLAFVSGTSAPAGESPAPAAASREIPWPPVLLGALLIGIAARGLWLAIGLARLRRLTRQGTVIDAEYEELQQQLGTRATITEVVGVSQPATFGVRRPVVMLPDALAAAPESLRRAVITHELFHVRRRDWVSVLAEEAICTVLWFHPAILWLTSHIQLAREEIVDELTVRATGDRRTYMQALLSYADTTGLSPAPAFAHRRQLFHRILSVSKENVMSTPRLVTSAIVLIAAVFTASWSASALFPIVKAASGDALTLKALSTLAPTLHGTDSVVITPQPDGAFTRTEAGEGPQRPGTQAVEPRQVTAENPIPRRTRAVSPIWPPAFPAETSSQPLDVVLLVDQASSLRTGAASQTTPEALGERLAVLSGRLREIERAQRLAIERENPNRQELTSLQREFASLIDQIARLAEEARLSRSQSQDATLRLEAALRDRADLRNELAQLLAAHEAVRGKQAPSPTPSPSRWLSPSGRVPLRIPGDGSITPPRVLVSPKAEYTPEAMKARVEGTVAMEVLVDEDGRVPEARVIRSIPLLDQAALDTVKTWRFTPARQNGNPVPVLVIVELDFNLRESPR